MLTQRQKSTDNVNSGQQVAYALTNAIEAELPDDAELLIVHAYRLLKCNSLNNIWMAQDLHDRHGVLYSGSGRFWNCGSKLCQSCLAKTTRRNRKHLTAIMESQKLIVGESFHFLTLTMPNRSVPLQTARRIMNYAWVLLRKKKWFRDTFSGGVKSEEFTLTKRGYHYHLHLILRGKFVSFASLRHFWTDALRVAHARLGLDLSIATSDGLAIANVRKIGSIRDAVNEVAKYITKQSSWLKLRAEDLLDCARIRRWPRMFEFVGSFRGFSSSECVADREADENSVEEAILDKKALSDGELDSGWRSDVSRLGVAQYLAKLENQIVDNARFRITQLKSRYIAAQFTRLKLKPDKAADNILIDLARIVVRRDGTMPLHYQTRVNKFGGIVDVTTGNVLHFEREKL